MTTTRRWTGLRAAVLLTLLSPALPLAGQVVPLDDAVFLLSREGTQVGEEHVSIHRLGLGQDARVIGHSEVRLTDGSEMRPQLEATSDFRATAYENRFSGAEEGQVMISRAGRRMVAQTRTASGESQREFRATDATVVLEEERVLPYYLLTPWIGAEESALTILDPREGSQERYTLRRVGTERMRVERQTVNTVHLRLEGAETRELWFDEEGRLVRLEIPALGFVAERQDS